ncbi:MAG TPA: tryptophan 2,3-dioxygenase family protein [Candidatus Polarisedimenticolia bacterium]|nr:tryptophan 2,3-dioxygenase family protein [Candidatus Polarisedimenticolia bacterium]
MKRRASSYNDYLKVPELLALQQRLSRPPHHDEMLFIVIHQVYELWFREMLHEAEAVMAELAAGRVRRATRLYRRMIEIQRVLLQQIPVLETMTPIEFNQFRDLLNPASGFQSVQFRELEFLSGMKDPVYLKMVGSDAAARETLRRRLESPSLADAFDGLLRARGFALPPGGAGDPRQGRLAALKVIYDHHDDHDDLYQLCEAMIEYDENFQLWRYHHVRMVERMIGGKPGTGGSEGVGYLVRTLDKRCFPELWEVRTLLTGGGYGS